MAITTSAPALDLTAQQERPIVKIDGISYEMRVLNDLTFVDMHRIDSLRPRIEELATKLQRQETTEEEANELSKILTNACELVLDAPADIIAKLKDVPKLEVFKVFHERLLPQFQQTSAMLQPKSSTGPSSSPVSNGSTAANRARGKRARRSASSGRA